MFYRGIYTPYKIKTQNISFPELIEVLQASIRSEIEIYEKNIFDTRGAISNSNFDNYYHDIINSILNDLSPTFFARIGCFLTEDSVVSMIARTVRAYLVEKTNTVE